MTTDDAPSAIHSVLGIVDVHRSALSTGCSRLTAHNLCHYGDGIGAQEQRMGMVTISGDDIVVALSDAVHPANGKCFHADVNMHVTASLSLAIRNVALLLKVPDENHVAVVLLKIGRRF